MTQPRDPDAIIATWLDDGPIDLPADTRRAIVVGLRTQPRARRMAILRGMPVNPLSRFLAAAAIVLAVGGLSIFVLSNRGSGPGALPTPSPAVSIAPSPSAPPTASPSADPLDTATWKTYVSSRYGFSIAHPAGWAEVPADHEGQGIGRALIRFALSEARARGLQVVPLCPFFAAYIRKHREEQDLLAPEQRAALGLGA